MENEEIELFTDKITNVSVCIYYDSSSIFNIYQLLIGGGDYSCLLGCWVRRNKGLISIFNVLYKFKINLFFISK